MENLEPLFNKVLSTIKAYPDQFEQAWQEAREIKLDNPALYQNIVFCGMGGSALGARMVKSLMADQFSIPFEIYTEYNLPKYADEKTLVIAGSYSGNTEETVSCFNEAIEKGCGVFVITTGGKLADLAREANKAAYVFEPKHNPSEQPRMALGYSSSALLSFLNANAFISLSEGEVQNTISEMRENVEIFSKEVDSNPIKILSEELFNKIPILVASEHLIGAVHAIKNQLNESSKTFSAIFDIPELNHHLMEGLPKPDSNKETLRFLFFESSLYSDKISKRYPLTKEVVEKNNVKTSSFKLKGVSKMSQVYEVLTAGSFMAYFLTKKYNINPMEIPWVDYFKAKLSS